MSDYVKREREIRLWWEQSDLYFELPFYADIGMCCEIMGDRDNELCGREQLFAIRELGEESGSTELRPDNSILKKMIGGTE